MSDYERLRNRLIDAAGGYAISTPGTAAHKATGEELVAASKAMDDWVRRIVERLDTVIAQVARLRVER